MHDNLRHAIFASDRRTLKILYLTAALSVCCVATGHGQVFATRPALLSGPWELVSASGVDGIFVMVHKRMTGGTTRETIQVRVYHRKDGDETWGWHVVSPPKSTAVEFDGRRLRVAGLTATFDQQTARWTGTWSLDGQTRTVVLERPGAAKNRTSSPLCGTWEGLPDPTLNLASNSVRIHIVQSSDGALTAWMNTTRVIIDQRFGSEAYGQSLKVVSTDPANVILQNESRIYQTLGRFSGALSNDGNSMTGTWNGFPARYTLRRIPQ